MNSRDVILEKMKYYFGKFKWIFVFLCTFPFYNDSYTSFSITEEWIMDYIKIFVFFILFVLTALKNKKFSGLFVSLAIYEVWWMISTRLNYPLNEVSVFEKTRIDILNALGVALIVEFFKDDPKNLLLGLMLSFELAIYPELISVIRNVNGDNAYILGFYSTSVLWILPALCVGALHFRINKGYIRGGLLVLTCLFIEIKIWCATMIVSLLGQIGLFILGVILLFNKKTHNFKIPLSVFVILSILLNVFALFVYTGGNFPFIDLFIEKFLRRSTTFTERVVIWQESIRMIKESPWIGHGYRPIVNVANSFANYYIHSHNQLLQCLNARGIIGLILFTIFHIVLCIKTDNSENTVERLVVISSVFAITLTYITEAYKKFSRFYIVFFLAYHIDDLIKKKIINTDYLLK